MTKKSLPILSDQGQAALEALLNATNDLGFDMASEPAVGAFLRTLVASKPGGRMLELGTGTGLSSVWMLEGLVDDAELVSVDNDATVQAVAQEQLGEHKGLELVCLDGSEFINEAQPGSYDLIFADAWPGKYSHLDETLALLKAGGIYVVDDLLPQANWPDGHQANVDVFINDMLGREDFQVSVMEWASGLLVAVKR